MYLTSRRSLLKSLAALPLLPALEPLSRALTQSGGSSLEVWFHGLFALVFESNGITAVTPYITEHAYMAQTFAAGAWGQTHELMGDRNYQLSGVPLSLPRPAKTKDDSTVSGITQIDYGKSYFRIRLPFPAKITPARYVNAGFDTCPGNTHVISGSRMPLLHIFTYENVADSANLNLGPEIPFGQAGQKQTSLHLFAEPDDVVSSEHANHAFAQLTSIFPELCLSVNQPGVDPGQCPLLDVSVNQIEQLGLVERGLRCRQTIAKKPMKVPGMNSFVPASAAFGIEASDCSQIIINP